MNDPRNPYAPPTSHVADRDEIPDGTDSGRFIPYGRSVSPGQGAAWIGNAWRILRANPGMWAALLILLLVAWFIVSLVAARIPFLNLALQFLTPFVYAAIALAADEQRRTGTFDLKVLVGGFEKAPASLLAVGATVLLASIVFGVVLAVILGADILGTMMGRTYSDPSVIFSTRFGLAFLIGLVLMLPIAFAAYLAPQLIVLQGLPALTAMKMSLIGCAKNILPGIVFFVLTILLIIASAIPLGLGLLISIPIMTITYYTVYRDIFIEENS